MPAVNSNELAKFVGELYVAPIATPTSFVRVASVRNLQASDDPTANQVEVNADDTGTVYKGTTPEGRITATFLETFKLELLPIFFGSTVTSTPGTLVSGATQTIAGGSWVEDQFIPFEGQNSDGTVPTINSVSASTSGAMADDDDYRVGQNTEGVWGIYISTSGTATVALTEDVVVDYDYTPNASKSTELSLDTIELPRFVAKVVATDPSDETKERTIVLSDASIDSSFVWGFLDVVENGDIAGTDINIKGNKGSTLTITDEIL